uniref:TIR domain-containing protein n=1 Tax=Strigamia maritima TaxID=126957 RepID=T1JE86_STRMM
MGIPSYKLCLHSRDWRAGEFITDQIVKSVESSRRTIIVLTDNYLKSNWSRLEFDVAYQQALKDQVRRVIAVVPDEVPDLSKIDKEFKSFITLTTYVEAKKPYFWRKLRASMPRTNNTRKASNTRKSVYLKPSVNENTMLNQQSEINNQTVEYGLTDDTTHVVSMILFYFECLQLKWLLIETRIKSTKPSVKTLQSSTATITIIIARTSSAMHAVFYSESVEYLTTVAHMEAIHDLLCFERAVEFILV